MSCLCVEMDAEQRAARHALMDRLACLGFTRMRWRQHGDAIDADVVPQPEAREWERQYTAEMEVSDEHPDLLMDFHSIGSEDVP